MLDLLLTYLVNYGIKSNIVVSSGAGALMFAREKRYRMFRYLSALYVIIGIAVISVATYFLNMYVLTEFDLEILKMPLIVLLAGLYCMLVSLFWKKATKFGRYLYGASCAYAFDLIFIVYVVATVNMSLEIAAFMFSILAIAIVVFIMNFVIGFYVESINRSYLNVSFRNVAARLCLLSIFAILLYYAEILVI